MSALLAIIVIVCILGSWLIWWLDQREKERERISTAEWEMWMTPNQGAQLTPHRHPDQVE
jgi:hypothetical protein